MIKKTILLFVVFIFSTINAQDNYSGNLSTFVDSIITNMPQNNGTNEYQTPAASVLTEWGTTVENLINENYATAHTSALTFGYKILNFTENSTNPNKTYYVLVKNPDSSNYWGTFIINPLAERKTLFIQCPHPIYDTNTGKQGISIFKNVGARAFIVSGTFRCNATTESACAGSTSVCGADGKFKISDQAHTIDGTFQKSTETINSLITNLVVIQPHGFTKTGGDPDLIMSNGTKEIPTNDYLSSLKTQLLMLDNDLTFKISHIDPEFDRLFGTTNTQGRFINGSNTPCTLSASSSDGYFLHIEQAYDSLRDSETNWNKLSTAIENTFPSDPLPVELTHFSANIYKNNVELFWQTATELNNYGFEIQRQNSELSSQNTTELIQEWEVIGFVNGHGNSNSPKFYNYIDAEDSYGKLNYRLKQIDFDGKFEFSEIIEIENIYDVKEIKLEQNYPNPFNPETKISFFIPFENYISLKVFNALGEEINTIFSGKLYKGKHNFIFNGNNIPSGIYFYKLISESNYLSKKMILIK